MPRTKRQTSVPKNKRLNAAMSSRTTKGAASNTLPKSIKQIKRELSRELMQYPIVSGIGIETNLQGAEQIKVYLNADDDEFRKTLPDKVDGIPVIVEMIGPVKAY